MAIDNSHSNKNVLVSSSRTSLVKSNKSEPKEKSSSIQRNITREVSNKGNLYSSEENNIGLPPIEELISFVRNGNKGIGPYLKQHGYKDSGWFRYPELNENYGRESFCRNCTLNKNGVPVSFNRQSSIISSAHYGIGPTLVITVFNKEDLTLVRSFLSDNNFKLDEDNVESTNNQLSSMINEIINIAVDFEKDEQNHYSITIRRDV